MESDRLSVMGETILGIRTMHTTMPVSVIHVGNLRIDRVRFEVKVRGHDLRLSRKEFELLWVLASEDGRAFRRDELIDHVWGNGFFVDARTVDVHIARLRTKLREISGVTPAIETVWGIGYRFRSYGET